MGSRRFMVCGGGGGVRGTASSLLVSFSKANGLTVNELREISILVLMDILYIINFHLHFT